MSANSGAADLLAVAQIARRAGDGALARRALNEARALFPEDPAVHFAFGQDCLIADDIDRAREAFARVVELDPTNVRAWINYGAAKAQRPASPDAPSLNPPSRPSRSGSIRATSR